jgi:hypothetical protein
VKVTGARSVTDMRAKAVPASPGRLGAIPSNGFRTSILPGTPGCFLAVPALRPRMKRCFAWGRKPRPPGHRAHMGAAAFSMAARGCCCSAPRTDSAPPRPDIAALRTSRHVLRPETNVGRGSPGETHQPRSGCVPCSSRHTRTGDPNPLHALLDRFGASGDRHVAEIFVQRVLTRWRGQLAKGAALSYRGSTGAKTIT